MKTSFFQKAWFLSPPLNVEADYLYKTEDIP